ncbi:hypothetical protein SSS_06510 [Sarcoptes scabiei]|uniref:Uncharacterized protein n=1 Tax=Sarcoptes scabiei TaxID=52283 RepID=A0A834RCV7_SARSC|nr:hypothetical protein SSS_06510 [Sarcoptes scabiei]UXI16227.1 hypothetical protein NH340_JMT02170 [Sarcoptes scabiei]
MGTTGRFGGGGHGLTGPKHIWYDTDYSELYKGLAVVIGFFLFLVLLLLIFILISYLRKWYRLKKRPANDLVINEQGLQQHQLQPISGGKQSSRMMSLGVDDPLLPQSSVTAGSSSSSQILGNKQSINSYCKKHSRVGLSSSSINSSTTTLAQSQTSKSVPSTAGGALGSLAVKSPSPLINSNLIMSSRPSLPSTNIDLIQANPNIVMASNETIDPIVIGGGVTAPNSVIGSAATVGGINPSSNQMHHHQQQQQQQHYQEFPPNTPAVMYSVVHPGIVGTINADRKDSHSSLTGSIPVTAPIPSNEFRSSGRSSLATINLS